MGINIGPEEFQMKMQEKFGNLPGCEIIMDDMLVYGEDMETHNARLKKVLETVQEAGIKLNEGKCHFRKTSVKFFGHEINSKGILPDREKIEAITDLPAPTNITELRSLMGMRHPIPHHHADECETEEVEEAVDSLQAPDRPWSRVSADLCEFRNRHYLVVIDQYSRWIELKALTSLSTTAVINRLKDIIATHGVFDELMTDNGPQFVSSEFHEFAKAYGFSQITSSPHFPQANGEAESAVKIAKKMLAQADPHLALLNYRSSIHSAIKISPAEALMGRRIQTRIPRLSKTLDPKITPTSTIRKADEFAKEQYKHYYDRRHGAREAKQLVTGQQVMIKLDGERSWSGQGTVTRSYPEGRTYNVKTATGDVRRNRNQLQAVPSPSSAAIHPSAMDPVADPDPEPTHNRSSTPQPPATPQPPSDTPHTASLQRRSGRIRRPPKRYVEQCDNLRVK